MGRPKGSRNAKKKQDRPVIGNPIPTDEQQEARDVTPQPDQAQAQDAVAPAEEVAPGDAQEGGEEIAPPMMPTSGRPLDEIAHEMATKDGEKRELEGEKAEVMKDYNKRIGILDAKCAELAAEYLAAERPETYDYKGGWKIVWDGRTGRIIDRIALGTMVQLPLAASRPKTEEPQPPKATFQDLVDGKTWEHEVHGFVRVLAVLEDSVRVQTEDLDEDEDEAGIEIGRADWDANEAHPREMPELEIGQTWVVDGREAIITGLDDFAALVTWTEDDEPARIARLTFCGAMRPGAQDETPAVPALEAGQHWRLVEGELVTVTEANDTHAKVTWAKSGLGGSVYLAAFAGATAATQEDVDAALVVPEVPEKKSRKRAAGEG